VTPISCAVSQSLCGNLPEGDLEAIRPLWPHKQAAPRKKRLKLSELLAQCDPKAGGEIDFDAPVGKETR
jgi:hypothetical protein